MVGCWGRSLSLGRLVPNPHSKHETPENSVSTGACPRGPGGVLWWARPGRAPCPSLVRPSRWPTPQESLVCSGHGAHSSAGAVAPLTSCQQGLPPGDHVVTVALCFCPSGGDVSVFFTTWTEGPSFGFSLPSGSELCECRPAFRADAAAQHPLSTVGPPVWGGLRRTRLAAGAGPWRRRPGLAPTQHWPVAGFLTQAPPSSHRHDSRRESFPHTWVAAACLPWPIPPRSELGPVGPDSD